MATTGRAGWGICQGPGSALAPLPRCFEMLKLCFRNGACSSFRGYALEGECARLRVSSCGRSTSSLSAYKHRSATLQHHIPITAEHAVATSHHSAAFWPAEHSLKPIRPAVAHKHLLTPSADPMRLNGVAWPPGIGLTATPRATDPRPKKGTIN